MHAHRRQDLNRWKKDWPWRSPRLSPTAISSSQATPTARSESSPSAPAYEVRDNGVLIADSTTLTGVTDDIKINIDSTAGAANTVTLDLTGTTVDQVYAKLGNGGPTRSPSPTASAASVVYDGGTGADTVTPHDADQRQRNVKLGNGDNCSHREWHGRQPQCSRRHRSRCRHTRRRPAVTNNLTACLGNGDNTLTVDGSVGGNLQASAGNGADTVTAVRNFGRHEKRFAQPWRRHEQRHGCRLDRRLVEVR